MSVAVPLFSCLYVFRFWTRTMFPCVGICLHFSKWEEFYGRNFWEEKKVLLLALRKGSAPIIGLLRYSTRQTFQSD